jgi:nickel/cobalt exporter
VSATALGALATAGVLGVTHAVEPDHVAGISSLTGEYGDARLAALAGACFSVGHVALVVAWLAVASLVRGQTEFPAALTAAGTLGVGVLLGALGTAMAVSGVRRVLSTDGHAHGDTTHSHPHVAALPGLDASDHDHDAVASLRTGVVGALFTLSPPVSMLVFASTLLPDFGARVLTAAVATYAVAITVTMSLVGAGAGALFGATQRFGGRVHASMQALAGVAVAALAVSLLVDAASGLF